jgi:predicted ATPase
LFTDIEGSTRHLDTLGDAYVAALARHRALILGACERHGGAPVNREGDALFVAFERADAAAAAALDAQRALLAESWPGEPVRVRMGLHTGDVTVVDDGTDYVGMAVHIAARVAAAGHGGQILVSDVTHRLAGEPPADDLGMHLLKDVGDHRLLQLVADGLPREHPPLRTLSSIPNNLPAAVDAFVGRRVELAELVQAIDGSRLVTLAGPGGSGKTRLALEAATSLLPAFREGVWFVELAPVADSAGVVPAIAAALRVSPRAGQSGGDAVADWLRDRDVLLVLDNCEHVVETAVAVCDRLLATAPGLRILTTSREFLGLRGERAIRTPPLAIADDPSLATVSDAVDLFLTRAESNAPGFDRRDVDLDLVVQVCRRLDGLPLAIELAASRLRALSLEQLSARLDDRFRILAGRSRADLPRQRTLEAVVAWSYDLLADAERTVFVRLGVLPDHFTLEMAESVVSGDGVDELDVVDLVTRLVEKSLVTTVVVDAGLRYRLLETLRQYAVDRLIERAEADRWRARLADWSVGVAAGIEDVLRTPAMDRALRAATVDAITHLASAAWAAEHDRVSDALRIVGAIPVASAAERLPLLEGLLARAESVDDRALGFAFAAIGNLAYERGEWVRSLHANERAAALFERAGLSAQAAWSRYLQVHSSWGAGDVEAARTLVGDAVGGFRAAGDEMGLGYALWVGAVLSPDLDVAAAMAHEADLLLRAQDVPMGIAHNLEGRGLIELDRDDLTSAAAHVAEAVSLFASFSNVGCSAHALEAAAVVIARSGSHESAAELLGAAEAFRHQSGQDHRPWEVRTRHGAIERQLRLEPDQLSAAWARGRQHTVASASELALGELERGETQSRSQPGPGGPPGRR